MFNQPAPQNRPPVDPRTISQQQRQNTELGEIRLYWGVIKSFEGGGESHVVLSGMPLLSGMMSVSNPITQTFCNKKFDSRNSGLIMGNETMPERANVVSCAECRDLIDRLLRQVMDQ